jgi:nitroreductase
MLADLVARNRSYRRYRQTPAVTRRDLESWVELARLAASGGNLQSRAYYLSSTPATNAVVFPHLRWAGYLADWEGPAPEERPTGYIILLRDLRITRDFPADDGIAAEILRLAAAEAGFGSCLIGSLDRRALGRALALPERYVVRLAISFGAPGETIRLEEVKGGDIRYWRDAAGVHHVPKRSLAEVLVN